MSAPSPPTSNRSTTPGTLAIASISWSISSSSPSPPSSAAATDPPPSIAGPNTANPGWLSSSPCPTASPHATAFVACSSCSSPRPSNAASRPGSATRSPPTPVDPDRLVAIDGKTCRGSRDHAKDLGALHIVSAWATEEGIASGPGRHRRQIQRDHRHSEAPGADRPERGTDHDRRDGLPERDRQADRHRWRRLRDRRQGQPTNAAGGDPEAVLRSSGGRPER